jgi:hypothetical protein
VCGIIRIPDVSFFSRARWRYYGTLIVVYGDKQDPKYETWDGYYVTVSDVEKPPSPPSASPRGTVPDGRSPDGRRPLRRFYQKLPESSRYQHPTADLPK